MRNSEFINKALKNPVFPWVIVFIFGCLIIPQNGCQLELPRMLTLRAMSEDNTFQITRYIDWTDEWSRTPDGRYYNNRAPGPVLIPFPVFYLFDKVVKLGEGGKLDDKGRRPWPGYFLRTSLSLLFQEIPFSFLVMAGASWMLAQGISLLAIHFFALAALFGNTAAIFMNNWSGHGLTSVFVLGIIIALLYRRYFWIGLCYGGALLSDYGSGTLLLPLLLAIVFLERKKFNWLLPFILGGLGPGILWIWYHVVAFGGPFTIANYYQNPMYLNVHSEGNIHNLFMPVPDLSILYELILGARRGILPTQPWVLWVLPLGIYTFLSEKISREAKAIGIFSVLGFCFLLVMNATFGGWYAGNSSGPRYLCSVFPVLGFFAALIYDTQKRNTKLFLWFLLIAALLFRGLVFAVNPVAPLEPLWGYLWQQIVEKETLTNWLRFGIYIISMAVGTWFVWKKEILLFYRRIF